MKFLVPYDFSGIARVALNHAFQLSKSIKGDIELLHIVSEEKGLSEAEKKFTALLGTLNEEEQRKVTYKVVVGDIFKDIAKVAEEEHAQLLVMPTHGEKGLQKLFGSNAMRVITSSKSPFIVTQDRGPGVSIERIVLPVNLATESVQVVRFAAAVANAFDAEVHVIYEEETDEWLSNTLKHNIGNAKLYLKKEGVAHVVQGLPGESAFHKEVVKYGARVNADLFAVAHFSESILPQFDRFSQEMITNKLEIPVLIVNAHQVEGIPTNFTFIGM